MDYIKSTFFSKYTPLTTDYIVKKLTPSPAAVSVTAGSDALQGKEIKIVLDDGVVLEYVFSKDTLDFKENTAKWISIPYSAKSLEHIVMFTHMIPDTIRGYGIVYDTKTSLVTAFEVWFGGFEADNREVWRHFMFGYAETDKSAPEARHALTNRIEGKGTYWEDDNGVKMLYFFPSVVWSSFVELSDPLGGITITAPSDYIKIDDKHYIYSRVEQEFSGTFTLEVLDFFTVRHIGMRLGFDKNDNLDYSMYFGKGEVTGQSTSLAPLDDFGIDIPYDEKHLNQLTPARKGLRPFYRPRFMHDDYTKEEVDEIIKTNSILFRDVSVMKSVNYMEATDYMIGKKFTLSYDEGPVWEYEILDIKNLRWRVDGEDKWHEEVYMGYEVAKDIVLFSHICTGTDPLRCPSQAVDFSTGLTSCIDARLGNKRKPWEVEHRAVFGILEIENGPVAPAVERHGHTTELVGQSFSWNYSPRMKSIHIYSSPESYSWSIILERNTGGWMWSSPCTYVKLREDAYLISWIEANHSGGQGTLVFNPWIMHDSGFFFGIGNEGGVPDMHLAPMGAYTRPLHGFDILKYYDIKCKR